MNSCESMSVSPPSREDNHPLNHSTRQALLSYVCTGISSGGPFGEERYSYTTNMSGDGSNNLLIKLAHGVLWKITLKKKMPSWLLKVKIYNVNSIVENLYPRPAMCHKSKA